MKDTPDGFKETEIGPIPVEWEIVRLGDLAPAVNSGATPRGGRKTYLSSGIPFIRSQNVLMGYLSLDDIACISEDIHQEMRRSQVLPGDVLLNITGASIGRVTYVPDTLPVANVNQHVCRIRLNEDRAHPPYLAFHLATNRMQAEIMGTQFGTTRQGLNYGQVRMLRITLPSLHEQHRIAYVLSAIQRAIATQDELIAAARTLKRSLMQHLFTYGPGTDPAPTKETEIGEIPEHWDVVRLGKALQATQYGLSVRADLTGRYPMLRMNNLVDGQVDVSDLKYVGLSEDAFTKFRLHRRDVLFNRTNSYDLVGKTAIFNIDGNFTFASYLIRVIPDISQLLPEYLNYYLNWDDAQRRLKMLATRGVSQSNISATKLKRFVVGLPPLAKQDDITRILVTADRKIAAEQNRKAALQALFKSTLHQLMTGQIRLRDTEL